jgi:hypothetical protein
MRGVHPVRGPPHYCTDRKSLSIYGSRTIGFAATGRRVVVAHSEKRILASSRKRCLRDHAQGSYRCSGRRISRRFANSREQRAHSSPRYAAGRLRPRVFRGPLSCKPRNWRGRNYQRQLIPFGSASAGTNSPMRSAATSRHCHSAMRAYLNTRLQMERTR